MENLDTNTEIDTATVVHDLLKKANRYYQSGQNDLSVMCFNDVLDYEPGNTIALYFLKLKLQQFENEKVASPSEQAALSLSVIQKNYQTAFNIINDNTSSIFAGAEYDELKEVISDKFLNQLKSNIGDLEQNYITTERNVVNLKANEIKMFDQFRTGVAPRKLLNETSQNPIHLLTIIDKLITKSYIKKFTQPKSNLIHLNVETRNQANVALNQESIDKLKIQEDYESLFKQATAAYVRRNYKESLALYEKCQQLDPENSKISHNINKLKERLN